ncbi:MAG: urea ABC transporter permease subunit UrtB [Methylovulum sp.]|nr:urea ABC transporter permease subunit UrtB [Methylovulum sp.]
MNSLPRCYVLQCVSYVLLGLSLLFISQAEASDSAASLQASLALLKQSSMTARKQAITQLGEGHQPRSLVILHALLVGQLFILKSTDTMVLAEAQAEQVFTVYAAESNKDLGKFSGAELSKINLTNALRSQVRQLIAELEINAEQPATRLAAVKKCAESVDDHLLSIIKARLPIETDAQVKQAIQQVLLLQDMTQGAKSERIAAMKVLKNQDSLAVVNQLKTFVEKDSEGQFLETDADIRHVAEAALTTITQRMHWYAGIETVFFGLSLGAVLVLSAIGLAITFGVMGVINMAHGELMMLGAYTTYVLQQLLPNHVGLSLLLAIPAAFLLSAAVGMLIERGIIRFLYGRPLETLLATFGVSLLLQQLVRTLFSPLNKSVATPQWLSGSWQVNDFLSLTWNRFYIFVFCLVVFVALMQLLKRTRLGLEVRAVAQNRTIAKAMGIPTAQVDALTFGLGSGIAGVAGVALSQITNVGPNLGQAYIVDSFMVVVFGGVGNLLGTLVAGFSLGIANKFLEPFAGAVLAKILLLIFIILFIQKHPRGLFPQKGRAADS